MFSTKRSKMELNEKSSVIDLQEITYEKIKRTHWSRKT